MKKKIFLLVSCAIQIGSGDHLASVEGTAFGFRNKNSRNAKSLMQLTPRFGMYETEFANPRSPFYFRHGAVLKGL
jgi:hypothetical protein